MIKIKSIITIMFILIVSSILYLSFKVLFSMPGGNRNLMFIAGVVSVFMLIAVPLLRGGGEK